jgi:bifunctional DNA-binding transcriptional regulator/antitoxin component of YhaV-PrlF toxin-antitoxin module
MEFKRKVTKNGNSLQIIIPSDIVKFKNIKENDIIILTEDSFKLGNENDNSQTTE